MAENIVQGLFGLSPYQIQQQQNSQINDSAARFSQMPAGQRAAMGMYQAGAGLARPLAGMLGMVNPAEEEAKQAQGIQSQIDHSSAEGLMKGAQLFNQAGNPQMSYRYMQAAQARKAQEADGAYKQAQAQRLLAQSNQEASPVAKLSPKDYTPESWGEFAASGYKDSSKLRAVPEAGKTAQETSSIQEYRFAVQQGYKGSFEQWRTQNRAAGTNVSINMPKQAVDIVKSVDSFDEAVKVPKAVLEASQLAKTMINDASKSNNSQSWESARTTMAKAVGETRLSNEDIRRTGVDPRLVEGALNWISKKVEGVPNQDIMKQLYAVATILEKHSERRINEKSDRAVRAAKDSGFTGDTGIYFPRAGKQVGEVDFSSLKK